jgi:hypothetical protein
MKRSKSRTGIVVNVPSPPAKAFNPYRKASSFHVHHINGLIAALAKYMNELDTPQSVSILTEKEAADLIRAITAILHPDGRPVPPRTRKRRSADGSRLRKSSA